MYGNHSCCFSFGLLSCFSVSPYQHINKSHVTPHQHPHLSSMLQTSNQPSFIVIVLDHSCLHIPLLLTELAHICSHDSFSTVYTSLRLLQHAHDKIHNKLSVYNTTVIFSGRMPQPYPHILKTTLLAFRRYEGTSSSLSAPCSCLLLFCALGWAQPSSSFQASKKKASNI